MTEQQKAYIVTRGTKRERIVASTMSEALNKFNEKHGLSAIFTDVHFAKTGE